MKRHISVFNYEIKTFICTYTAFVKHIKKYLRFNLKNNVS